MVIRRVAPRVELEAAVEKLLGEGLADAERLAEIGRLGARVIGRFPGETSCLSLCWAVLDLFIASARGLALTALEHRQLVRMRADRRTKTPESLSA